MPWEKRFHKKYYYFSRKVSGRVIRKYLGAGPLAELVASQVEQRRADREIQTRTLSEMDASWTKGDLPLRDLCEVSNALIRASLITAGYTKYRGEWRIRHGR